MVMIVSTTVKVSSPSTTVSSVMVIFKHWVEFSMNVKFMVNAASSAAESKFLTGKITHKLITIQVTWLNSWCYNDDTCYSSA